MADPRVDLVGLVQKLSGDPHAASNPAVDEAVAIFGSFKAHPAVLRLARMRAKGFAWDAPAQYAVYLSTDMSEAYPAPDFFATLAGGKSELETWREELRDFKRISAFDHWFRARRAIARKSELDAVRAAAGARDLSTPLIAELGLKTWSSWTVIVSPFFPSGGGASWVREEQPGRPAVFVVYGPFWRKRRWRKPAMDGGMASDFGQGAWPEAAFSATYAVYEACRPVLKPVANACEGMPGLVNAEDCIQQTWVRALVSRLIESEYGSKAATEYRSQWPPTPFQAKVDAALTAYAGDRKRYRDLMDAAGLLAAPFQADGRAPDCRLIDDSRRTETVFTRRSAYYLEGRREASGGNR